MYENDFQICTHSDLNDLNFVLLNATSEVDRLVIWAGHNVMDLC